jgi:hypothetical protein
MWAAGACIKPDALRVCLPLCAGGHVAFLNVQLARIMVGQVTWCVIK